MNTKSRFLWGAWGALLMVACTVAGSKPKVVTPEAVPRHSDEPEHGTSWPLAAGSPTNGLGQQQAAAGHRFEPRPMTAHAAPHRAQLPALATLPSFVDGSSQCFREQYGSRVYPPYSAPNTLGGGYGSGATPLSRAPLAEGKGRSKDGAGPPTRGAPQAEASVPAPPADSGSSQGSKSEKKAARRYQAAQSDVVSSVPYQGPSPGDRQSERNDGYGAAVYLSNDDTMSLSSAQRVIYAIERFAPLPAEHIRPHELLNYFSFGTRPVDPGRDFSVTPSIAPHPELPGVYTLALAVQGRPSTLATRRNANLSFVIDRSGSMSAEGRMDYLKRGMLQMLGQLKTGDIVSITLFDSSACQLAQNFVVGRDSEHQLRSLIERINPTGATNLHDGLQQGYQVANAAYQPEYTNRVVLITDALTNTGITDSSLISMVAKHHDDRKIRLSGVGVGSEFNDELLDQLTERGKGAYVFLGSDAEVDAVFGSRFVSLIETIAADVHFRLHLPPSLAMQTFYGEEASTQKERVQAIHYFAGTSQMFLSDLRSRSSGFPGGDDIMLTIEYQEPEQGRARVEEYAFALSSIFGETHNLNKARLIDHFSRTLGKWAARPLPRDYRYEANSWRDDSAFQECREESIRLHALAESRLHDAEVARIVGLWDTFCERYVPIRSVPAPRPAHQPVRPLPPAPPLPAPGPPVRNNDFAPPDQWPSAQR